MNSFFLVGTKNVIEVCLIRTQIDHVPFIFTIESKSLYNSYKLMENDTALYLERRINYGANNSIPGVIRELEQGICDKMVV
ncbi:hypothetical protein TIFTF001_000553 [Ficus carica]|uniref:Uncharacterized protein n=1 Tax=Ficus carica TaxID=3494 RepID=A0AA88D1L9_FICCA|nr:hypothetical protein TIFTF001_000553 [Ficus carica]